MYFVTKYNLILTFSCHRLSLIAFGFISKNSIQHSQIFDVQILLVV